MTRIGSQSFGKRTTPPRAVAGLALALLTALCAGQGASPSDTPSETEFARTLRRLRQVEVMESQRAAVAGTPTEALWRAELVMARYEALTRDKSAADVAKLHGEYLAALHGFFQAEMARDHGASLDGAWALEHAQFVLSHMAQPLVNRMEYFAGTSRDRALLLPPAQLAETLLAQAAGNLERIMLALEAARPFDEKAYARRYATAAEVRYYQTWAAYFLALGTEPSGPAARRRQEYLARAIAALEEWAVEEPDNGVNFQAFLLRGKAHSEAGQYPRAIEDFARAQSPKAPDWVQYQGRYQTVVALLRAGDTRQAQVHLDAFRRWIPQDNAEARISTEMLAYRVTWAESLARQDPVERRRQQATAMGELAAIIERDGRYRGLVYEQLAAQVPQGADVTALLPLQQLALAWLGSQSAADTPESRAQAQAGLRAAESAIGNPETRAAQRLEATFLAAACHGTLGNLAEAARFNVAFAQEDPSDPRARAALDLALRQIGELRRQGEAAGDARSPVNAEELRKLTFEALVLATENFADAQWLYARGRMLEDAGQAAEAAAIYARIGADDKNYIDARYRLVALAAARFSQAAGTTGTLETQKTAAAELFAACARFAAILDRPPPSAPEEIVAAARGYRQNIWLIETAAALHPAIGDTAIALDRLAKLQEIRERLDDAQQTAMLGYRVQALHAAGRLDQARRAIEEYQVHMKARGEDPLATFQAMALRRLEEIERIEAADAAQAARLAGAVAQLLEPIVSHHQAQGNLDAAFEYRLIQADMSVKARQLDQALNAARTLHKERETDLRAPMIEGRALFARARESGDAREYAAAQERFADLLGKLTPGSESYWEAWLRVIQAMEAQHSVGGAGDIKLRLGDLQGVFGTRFGGERYGAEFKALAAKYGL